MPTNYNRSYFSLFEIPYFNELTANQLGFSTEFNADTPNQYFVDSLNSLQNFFQGGSGRLPQGTITNPTNAGAWRPGMPVPEGYEIGSINGRQVLKPKQTIFDATQGRGIPAPDPSIIPMPPQIWRTNPPADVPLGTPGTQTPENNAKVPTPITDSLSGIFSGDMLGKLIGSDTAIGAGLVIIAIVLIIIGLLSLR